EYLGDVSALQLRESGNRAEDRTGEAHEGERRSLVVEDVLEPVPRIRACPDGLVEEWERGAIPGARDDRVGIRGRPVCKAHRPALAGRDIALGYDVAGLHTGKDLDALVEERPIVGCRRSPCLLAVAVE